MAPQRSNDQLKRSIIAGQRLNELRKSRQLSRQQLADQLTDAGYPISMTTIGHMEAGHPNGNRRAMTVDDLWALADFFQVPLENLLTGPDCATCLDSPPHGFTCNSCGKANTE